MSSKNVRIVACGLVALSILAVALRIAAGARIEPARTGNKPLTVETRAVRVQPMPVLLQAVGQVVSEHVVQIRPQVAGALRQVSFTEGEPVSAGQHLFRIDPAPFAAALASAQAVRENAATNADRLEAMAKRNYVTPQEYRNARAIADQAEAAYEQARINLSYTDLRAPIAGRTGSLAVKSGNVVSPSDAAPLVIINQMRPIEVQFSIAQQFLPRVRRYQAEHAIKITITGDDGAGTLDEGKLVFIDNAINTSTGTVMLKARTPNAQEQLWPAQYVGVRVQLTVEPSATVVPQTAVQTGQEGNYVYVVVDGKAVARNVTVDRQIGDLAVISSGISAGEQVVSRAPRNLRTGMQIVAEAGNATPPAEVSLPGRQ